ncbi:hypothetical protein [Streptomyces achromogenes]|uniref:hypothetical protein n=1 Tax=Streptomyces achromogenes TaxID=67255 RepID=UPI003689F499
MTERIARGPETTWAARITGAALCLAVAVIHVKDQGGVTATRDPYYVGVGYHVLEIVAVATAVLLLVGAVRPGWLSAAGLAVGPLVGYLLSRGPGLPGYTDDVGNWTEPLGLVSLAVEGALLILAAPLAARGLRRRSFGTRRRHVPARQPRNGSRAR